MSANTPLNNVYADPKVAAINVLSGGSASLKNVSDAVNHWVAQITNANINPSQRGTIYFPPYNGTYTFSTSCTVPEGVHLVLEQGATLSVNSGKTLTLAGGYSGRGKFTGSGSVVIQNIEKIDVRDFGVKLNDSNDYSAELTSALTAINAVTHGSGTVAYGAQLLIPAGVVNIDGPITISSTFRNVSIVGALSKGGNSANPATVLKATDNAAALFDLGSAVTSNVIFKNLALVGSGGTTLTHRAVTSASATSLTFENCFINSFGGSGIRIDAGSDNRFIGLLMTNCLLGYAGLSGLAGVLELGSIETFGYDCNINGVAGVGAHSNFGSGYMCAGYFKTHLQHWNQSTFAFGQTGVRVDDAKQLHRFTGCRFEYNQGYGLDFAGIKSHIIGCRFQDNSQDTDNTYAHVVIGRGGGTKGYDNVWIGNRFDSITYQTYVPTYGFDVQAGGGTGYALRNEFLGNIGTGFTSAMITHTGAAPIATHPFNFLQAVSKANGETATFDAQQGDLWKVTCTGATATIAAPTNPLKGQIATLDILNSSGGGLTITFNAAFKHAGYTDPANGKHRTARFMYDGTNWLLIGDWSADI